MANKGAARTRQQAQAKKGQENQVSGCLLFVVILLIVGIVSLVRACTGAGGPSGPALVLMKQIPGCTGITTTDGNAVDDNTVAEGTCQLADGTNVSVYLWAAGDDSDQHDYVYQNGNCSASSGSVADGCFVGSNPQPWFVDVSTSMMFSPSAAQGDWASVASILGGIQMTKIPASWCSTYCPPPGQHSGGGGFGGFGDGD